MKEGQAGGFTEGVDIQFDLDIVHEVNLYYYPFFVTLGSLDTY